MPEQAEVEQKEIRESSKQEGQGLMDIFVLDDKQRLGEDHEKIREEIIKNIKKILLKENDKQIIFIKRNKIGTCSLSKISDIFCEMFGHIKEICDQDDVGLIHHSLDVMAEIIEMAPDIIMTKLMLKKSQVFMDIMIKKDSCKKENIKETIQKIAAVEDVENISELNSEIGTIIYMPFNSQKKIQESENIKIMSSILKKIKDETKEMVRFLNKKGITSPKIQQALINIEKSYTIESLSQRYNTVSGISCMLGFLYCFIYYCDKERPEIKSIVDTIMRF